MSVNQSVSQSVSQSVGWLVRRSVGQSVSQSVSPLNSTCFQFLKNHAPKILIDPNFHFASEVVFMTEAERST